MKLKHNYWKIVLQWGVLASLVGGVLWGTLHEEAVDVEAYCPFGGLQALGSFLVNDSLACSMSVLQISMGVVLALGVLFFAKLFCGYLCPLGTVGEWMGRVGRRLHLQREVRLGGVWDRLLRLVKYALLFWILYNTLLTSELFCKKLDPYYAVATGFQGEIVAWMSSITLSLLVLGGFFVRMFWCRYICPLGAVSNSFKFLPVVILATLATWILTFLDVENAWVWVLGATLSLSYLYEVVRMKSHYASLLHIQHEESLCTHCGLCERRCPYQLPITAQMNLKHVDCTLCGTCISACPTDALTINGKKKWRCVAPILTLLLAGLAFWVGSVTELPTIDEKWGDYQKKEGLQTFEMEGLQSIKCFGSSKALSSKMQQVAGVYGVKTFVGRHAVEILYDPKATDTVALQRQLFTPTQRKFRTPEADLPALRTLNLGVEGLHDKMDMVYFGMALQQVEGIYGFTSNFGCPISVRLYVDPRQKFDKEELRAVIEAEELVFSTPKGDKIFPMHSSLHSFEEGEMVPSQDFMHEMFSVVAQMSGRFTAQNKKWANLAKDALGVYEVEYPSLEKMPIRSQLPYFKSFLSCQEGILAVDFRLREDFVPLVCLTYVRELWTDQRLWDELFQAPKWTLRMSDGTFQDSEPRLKFKKQGATKND